MYKWLESVAYTIAGGKGEQFEPLADEVIELVGRAQEPDGYLNTYFTVNAPERKWKNLIEGHESLPVRTFVSALLHPGSDHSGCAVCAECLSWKNVPKWIWI